MLGSNNGQNSPESKKQKEPSWTPDTYEKILSRIPVCYGQVNPQDCRKMAEVLIKCIPIKDISGETEKFYRDAIVRLAALIELLKYCYGERATLAQIPPLWTVLAQSDPGEHPIETLLQSNHLPASALERIRKDLLLLLRRQENGDAMVGQTAQQLLSQFESLASVTAKEKAIRADWLLEQKIGNFFNPTDLTDCSPSGFNRDK